MEENENFYNKKTPQISVDKNLILCAFNKKQKLFELDLNEFLLGEMLLKLEKIAGRIRIKMAYERFNFYSC